VSSLVYTTKIPTAMEMTYVHPRTPGIKHCSLWR